MIQYKEENNRIYLLLILAILPNILLVSNNAYSLSTNVTAKNNASTSVNGDNNNNNKGKVDVKVQEKNQNQIIFSVNVDGNQEIVTKQLNDTMKKMDIYVGSRYDEKRVEQLKKYITDQYVSKGREKTVVDIQKNYGSDGRLSLDIKITEGSISRIKSIHIHGNHAFKEKDLLDVFSTKKRSLVSLISGSSRFTEETFKTDLEMLKLYYADRGYPMLSIKDTKMTRSDDKKYLYIDVYIEEGEQYRIQGTSIEGTFLGKEKEVNKCIKQKYRDIFSRRDVIETINKITRVYGDIGYMFASVTVNPEIDETNRLVHLKYHIDPKNKVYINEIIFHGNIKTYDDVLRREMKLQESGISLVSKLDESMRRLNNLGYIKNVNMKIEDIKGTDDLINLHIMTTEGSSTSAGANIGYSDVERFLYGVNLSEQNIAGSGRSIGIGFQRSMYSGTYSVDYYDPYYTNDGVGLGISAYNQTTDPSRISMSSYSTNAYGISGRLGYPVSDYDRVNFGAGLEHIGIFMTDGSPNEIRRFVTNYGDHFNTWKWNSGWQRNMLDRYTFPRSGYMSSASLEIGMPFILANGLYYYRISANSSQYWPMNERQDYVLRLRSELGYGNGYWKMHPLPFLKNFYCGGLYSIHGFGGNALGPLDSRNMPIGGNVLADASLQLIFPNNISENTRTSAFLDVGNVFKNMIRIKDIRASIGVQLEWISPLGPLVFSLAKPIVSKGYDRVEIFEFSIGTNI